MFRREFCYPPEGSVKNFRLLIGTVSMVIYSKLRLVYDDDLECWRVNQDALLNVPSAAGWPFQ